MKIKKASPGLDPQNDLARVLGPGFGVEEYDAARPLAEQVADADVLLVRSVPVTAEVIDRAPRLRLIQRPGIHVEAVDAAYAARKGIPVCNLPAEAIGGGVRVAEHTVFLILALAKQYRPSQRSFATRTVGRPYTYDVRGKTLGLVGVGNTGEPLISMVRGLGMRTAAVKREVSPEIQRRLELDWLGSMEELEALLRQSDFLSVHLPLRPETAGFIGRREIAMMKDGAFLINIARGSIVDREALYEALVTGKLAGAGLDVFWVEPPDPQDPLLHLDSVVATPHIAGNTRESRYLLTRLVAENIVRVRNGEPPLYVTNL